MALAWRGRLLGLAFAGPRPYIEPNFTNAQKLVIINELWGTAFVQYLGEFDDFFDFFKRTCEKLFRRRHIVRIYGELLDLVAELRTRKHLARQDLIDAIRALGRFRNGSIKQTMRSVHLALYLSHMIQLGQIGIEGSAGFSTDFPRNQTGSIDTILNAELLTRAGPAAGQGGRRFDGVFNLYAMQRIGAIEIEWTYDLRKHLVLEANSELGSERILWIFRGATALQNIQTGNANYQDMTREALETLGLLLPNLPHCQAWYSKLAISKNLDPAAAFQEGSSRQVMAYDYWRERLVALQEEFDKSEHATLFAYFFDRRKPREWITFWVAVAAFLFAIIATFLQVLSIVYAQESLVASDLANSMASVASTDAKKAAATNGSSPTPICCCATTSGNYTAFCSQSDPSVLNSTSIPEVFVTDTVSTITTVSIIVSITSTLVVTTSVP